jgi:hypothetical protein
VTGAREPPRPFGKLPDLIEDVEIRIGKRRVEAFLLQEIQNLQQLRDKMMEEGPSMEIYDAALEIQEHIDAALGFPRRRRRPLRTSALCVAVINSWKVLKEAEPVRKMALLLLDLVETDPITKLGMIGEFA